MRRRVGADVIEIDTIEGTCRLWFLEPHVIDFEAIERAADDASYKLAGIALEIEGEVVEGRGALELVIPETGQRFALDGDLSRAGRLHVHANVEEWKGERARLTGVTGHASASGGSGSP